MTTDTHAVFAVVLETLDRLQLGVIDQPLVHCCAHHTPRASVTHFLPQHLHQHRPLPLLQCLQTVSGRVWLLESAAAVSL